MQSTEPVKIEQPFNGDGNNIYYINGGRCSGKVNRTLNELVEYANNLQKQNQKYKEIIDKAIEYMKDFIFEPLLTNEDRKLIMYNDNLRNFEKILKEME